PVPAPVAVHRVIPAADGRDAGNTLQVRGRAGRRGVAAVGERVHVHLLDVLAGGQLDQPAQVADVAVDAAVGDEAEQVQGRSAGTPAGVHEHRVLVEGARLEVVVDADEVLAHDPP